MKIKKFKDYLSSRVDSKRISELEEQSKLEMEYFESLQRDISEAISNYMVKNKTGLNELARQLSLSTSHVIKIQKGEANLTLSTVARIASIIKKKINLFGKTRS